MRHRANLAIVFFCLLLPLTGCKQKINRSDSAFGGMSIDSVERCAQDSLFSNTRYSRSLLRHAMADAPDSLSYYYLLSFYSKSYFVTADFDSVLYYNRLVKRFCNEVEISAEVHDLLSTVYNMEGNEVGTMELNDAVFGVEINEHLVHLAVVRQLANNRQGTQKAKTRSEVRGGGRKPWRQKGTGHARQGSIRAPQWTGGGVVFAPVPRDYEVKMNKKERRAALKSALTSKVQDNKLVVVDSLALAEVKTKEMQKVLTNLKAEKALVITADNDQNVILSARNIADVETATPATINTYDVMKHNTVVVTKDAVASIEEVYA